MSRDSSLEQLLKEASAEDPESLEVLARALWRHGYMGSPDAVKREVVVAAIDSEKRAETMPPYRMGVETWKLEGRELLSVFYVDVGDRGVEEAERYMHDLAQMRQEEIRDCEELFVPVRHGVPAVDVRIYEIFSYRTGPVLSAKQPGRSVDEQD